MLTRRASFIAVVVTLFVLTGCGEKPATTPAGPAEPKADPPSVVPPKDKVPNPGAEPPAPPEAIPVTAEDKKRVEDAEKKGATVVDGQPGGYEVRVEASADAVAILAALKGTRCVVGLSLEGQRLSDTEFAHVGDFEYLERLTIHACGGLTGTGFESLAKLPRLKSLSVAECNLADDACKPIGRIKSLEEVRLIRTKVTDAGLRELAALPALELLLLDGTPVTGSAFAAAGWPKLRDIDVTKSAFDDTGMEAVAGLPSLESLRVDGCKITDDGLRHMARAKKLAELSLSGTQVTDTGTVSLRNLDSLRVLDVSNTVVAGQGFGQFPTRPSLRKLHASNTHFDDEGAAHLAKFPNLTSLEVANTGVSDAGLTVLKDLKKLAKCDLSGTKAGDDTAKLLGALPVEDVSFARTGLTDAGLKSLASGSKIRQIDARGTKATKEGAERAKMGRTRLDIRIE